MSEIDLDLVVLLDPDGVVRYESPSVGRLLGIKRISANERRLMDFVHPDDAGSLRELIANALASAGARHEARLRLRRHRAEWRVLVAEGVALSNSRSGAGVLVSLRDLGSEKQTRAAMDLARSRLRERLSRYPAVVRHFDLDGICRYCNWTWREFTGRISDGDGISDWMAPVHPSDRQLQLETLRNAIVARKPIELEYRLRHRNGDYRWIREIMLPAFEPNGALSSYVGIGFDVKALTMDEGEVRRSQSQLRALNARLHRTREQERIRISREVHDVLGQDLTALRFEASAIRQSLNPSDETLKHRLEAIEAGIDASIDSLQRFVTELRPRVLDDFGLEAAIEWVLSDFSKRVRIACDFSISGDLDRLSLAQETAVFRILQEATTNVARHARAQCVRVDLDVFDGKLKLEVLDDGIGIAPALIHDPRSLGLVGMHERAREIGGWLSIECRPTGGTRVRLDAPLERRLTRKDDTVATTFDPGSAPLTGAESIRPPDGIAANGALGGI